MWCIMNSGVPPSPYIGVHGRFGGDKYGNPRNRHKSPDRNTLCKGGGQGAGPTGRPTKVVGRPAGCPPWTLPRRVTSFPSLIPLSVSFGA